MMRALRNFFKPTPEAVKAAAPLGSDVAWSESQLYSMRDLEKYNPDDLIPRKGHGIYQKMMRDEQVKAVMRFKRDAITSRQFYFDYDDDVELSDAEKDRRIGMVGQMIDQVYAGSFSDGLNFIMKAAWQGFSLTEKIIEPVDVEGEVWLALTRLRPKPFDTIKFYVNKYGVIDRVVQELDGEEQQLNLEKFIYYVQNPDLDEHYGQSELREAYRSWWAKDVLIKLWNLHLERHASGFIWAQPRENSSLSPNSPDYRALVSAMSSIQQSTSLLLPANMDLNVAQPARTDAYEKALAYHDKGIAKSLLVPELLGISQQGDTGSYSQSATQLETFLWTLEADTVRLEEAINEQVFRQLGRLNFADGLAPRFRFNPVSDKKKMEIIQTWSNLVTSGAVEATDTDEAYLRELLEFPEAGEPLAEPVEPPAGQAPPDQDPETPVGEGGGAVAEESILGQPVRVVSEAALSRATKRVAMPVISRQSEDRVTTSTAKVLERVVPLVSEGLARIEAERLGSPAGGAEVAAAFDWDSGLKRKLRTSLERSVRDLWELGDRHAKDELARAAREAPTFQAARLEDLASDYLRGTGLRMLGHLTDPMRDVVRDTLAQGLKYSWSFEVIREKITDALTRKGFIDAQANAELTGRTLEELAQSLEGAGVTPYRLRTMIRTNGFEAINEARYSVFTDPGLGDFVEALEYTAILDSRTTEICQHLDGRIYPKDDPAWDGFRPPNHFNCRSLLIPVTQIDTEVTGKDAEAGSRWSRPPTIEPQDGF